MALRPRPAATAAGRAFEGAFEAGLAVVVGVVLGYYADRWLGTEPFLLFLFLVLGGVAGFRRLLRIEWPKPEASPGRQGSEPDQSDRSDQSDRRQG